jgi:LmbE family N-acetylglucosaminyl deacetylase
MAKTVLVVAPHPDDESIGCGGMICLHRRRGHQVHVVFLTSGELGMEGVSAETARSIREAEATEAAQVLEVTGLDFLRLPDDGVSANIERGARALRKVLEKQTPDLIYLPHPGESHPDHGAALPLVRTALVQGSGRAALPELRGYEVWSPLGCPDWTENISPVMGRKLRAVRCYLSQLGQFRYDRAIRGLNQYRGVLAAGSRYAEAFSYLDPRFLNHD